MKKGELVMNGVKITFIVAGSFAVEQPTIMRVMKIRKNESAIL